MNKFIYLLILIVMPFGAEHFAQSKRVDINSNTVFKDRYGSRISFETFLEMTSGDGYEMKPIFDDSDKLVEIFVLNPSVAPNFVPPSQRPQPQVHQAQKTKFRSAPIARRSRTMQQPTAPQFETYDIHNNHYSLNNMYGKVVILKFWFAACKPCIEEIPQLNRLVDEFSGNPDVVFLGASVDKLDRVNSFLQRRPFKYNIIANARDLADKYMVIGYPTHIVINPRGKIEAVYKGVNKNIDEKLRGAIERAFQGPTQTQASFISNQQVIPQSTYSSPRPQTQTLSRKTSVDTEIPEKEVFISPQSLIKNESGEVVPFSQFVQLMREDHYELINRRDMDNSTYVLMRKVRK